MKKAPGWKRMWFKGNKVWAAVGSDDNPLVSDGKVLIKYRLDQEYEYRVYRQNLTPVDGDADPPAKPTPKAKTAREKRHRSRHLMDSNSAAGDIPENAIRIYTDGASSGNPGPAGIGVLLYYGSHRKEVSKYIGETTNNVAELEAIRVGLAQVKKKEVPVRLFTDSGYAFGLLVLGWHAKKNQSLVADIRRLMAGFRDLKLIKVKGHAGDEGNERADFLATSAAASGDIAS